MYDCLIVGAGLYGSILAYRARKAGMRPLVIEKRPHVGGNMYCEDVEGIQVHKYGPHIFHTSNKKVWDFVNSLVPFRSFRYCPLAFYKGRFYHLPFNMNTFYELWGTMTPDEAKEKIEEERKEFKGVASNLEEQAISLSNLARAMSGSRRSPMSLPRSVRQPRTLNPDPSWTPPELRSRRVAGRSSPRRRTWTSSTRRRLVSSPATP